MKCDCCGKKINGDCYKILAQTIKSCFSEYVIRERHGRVKLYFCADCVANGKIGVKKLFK